MNRRLFGTIAAVLAVLFAAQALAQSALPWREIKVGVIAFMAPRDLTKRSGARQIDSPGGWYDSRHFTLLFDYGSNTPHFDESEVNDSRFHAKPTVERLTIDGRRAVILTGASDGSGNCDVISDAFIDGPTRDEDLYLTGCGDATGAHELGRLYRSIRFTR